MAKKAEEKKVEETKENKVEARCLNIFDARPKLKTLFIVGRHAFEDENRAKSEARLNKGKVVKMDRPSDEKLKSKDK